MPRCSHEGAASSTHGKHQPADVKHIDVGPFILDSLPQFISVGGSVRPPLDSSLHLGPQILYRIHVWRLSRPGSKHVYVVSLKESSGCVGAMWIKPTKTIIVKKIAHPYSRVCADLV